MNFSPMSTSSSVKFTSTSPSAYKEFLNINPFKKPKSSRKEKPKLRNKKQANKKNIFKEEVLTMKIKLETSSSPKRSFKINRQNIKPLELKYCLFKRTSQIESKYFLTLEKSAVLRPYKKNSENLEFQELSCSEKMEYWRLKQLEQYKMSRNTSPASSGKKTVALKSRLTPAYFRGSIEEFARNSVKKTFTIKENECLDKVLDLSEHFRFSPSTTLASSP